jgi:hypothetical protein
MIPYINIHNYGVQQPNEPCAMATRLPGYQATGCRVRVLDRLITLQVGEEAKTEPMPRTHGTYMVLIDKHFNFFYSRKKLYGEPPSVHRTRD